ncbi:MAG TPA: EAL domain-containing protein [Burkholderiaceae bacterium]|jgi:diguanylate cyclase (GGDEF)-like protein/PAS domain S-box-containing protein
MKIDQFTIFWIFVLLQPVGILVYGLTARRHPHLKAPRWWALGCLLAMTGFTGVVLQASGLSSMVVVNLSNTLIIGATLCLWAGLRTFYGRTVSPPLLIAAALAGGVLHGLFAFVWPSLEIRSVIVSAFNGGGTLLALYEVLKQRKTSMRMESNLLGGLLCVDGTLHMARILGIVLVNHSGAYGSSSLEGIFMLTFLITGIGRLVIFVALISGRLQDEREAADAQLRASEMRFRKLLEVVPVSVQGYGADGVARYWNKASEQIYGYSAAEAIGQNLLDLIIPPGTRSSLRDEMCDIFLTGRVEPSEEVIRLHKDGKKLAVISSHAFVSVPDRPPELFCIDTDISERIEAENEIHKLAFFDPLTGLPNRRRLFDRLGEILHTGHYQGQHHALVCIDLDNFKTLNDNLGHHVGDQLLQQVGQRLCGAIDGPEDMVARLGGDEFLVLLTGLGTRRAHAVAKAEIMSRKLLDALNQTYRLGSYEHHSTPSLGVTLFFDHNGSIEDLLKRADLAMYEAKAAGRNAVRFFDPRMEAMVVERAALEAGLREALQKNQFLVYYQDQVDGDACLRGVEALLRWAHPERGMIAPMQFIPLAEDTGLIHPLGRWVLDRACLQLRQWADDPDMAHLTIAVNVSARQFHHREFVEQVLAALRDAGAQPHLLKLELTESLLLEDVADVIAKMTELKSFGVTFALDDFGTGYSSLSYLKRLPLDQLKIDRSFVKDVTTNQNDATIARTIVALGHSLGLEVIAEGVETEEQRKFLASIGCYAYQGFRFSKPMPIEEFNQIAERGMLLRKRA